MKFTEEKLENAFTELPGKEGFPHQSGTSIVRKSDDVLIEEDLRSFLLTQYSAQEITPNEVNSIILQLINYPGLNKQRQPGSEQLISIVAENCKLQIKIINF